MIGQHVSRICKLPKTYYNYARLPRKITGPLKQSINSQANHGQAKWND